MRWTTTCSRSSSGSAQRGDDLRVFFTGVQAFGEGKDAPHFYLPMSKILGEDLADRDYGGGLDCWFLLFIFERDEADHPRGKERMLYRRSRRELDLRLHADHEAWRQARKNSDAREQHRLLYDVARRSFDIMRKKKITAFDVNAFEHEVEAIAAEHGWTR